MLCPFACRVDESFARFTATSEREIGYRTVKLTKPGEAREPWTNRPAGGDLLGFTPDSTAHLQQKTAEESSANRVNGNETIGDGWRPVAVFRFLRSRFRVGVASNNTTPGMISTHPLIIEPSRPIKNQLIPQQHPVVGRSFLLATCFRNRD